MKKTGKMAQVAQKGAQVAVNYAAIENQVPPKVKGFVENIVSTFSDRMAKPKRIRTTHDFIEQQLTPDFMAQMQHNGSIILSSLQTAITEECKKIMDERKEKISDLMNAIKAQKGEYQQKIAKLKAYNATLNSQLK